MLPAAQLPVAFVDQDTGDPGLKKLRLPQLFQSPKSLLYCLVHGLQGVGLAAKIQIRGTVQPLLHRFYPAGKFLPVQSATSFLYLLEFPGLHFVFQKKNFPKCKNSTALPCCPERD